MLFGSFDGIHPGHNYLIDQAQSHGDQLIIVVAQDSVIHSIKQQNPIFPLATRIKQLQETYPLAQVIAGDEALGTWSAIKMYQPDIVIVGYDQKGLKKALSMIQEQFKFTIIELDAFHPETYKSSLLRKKNPLS